MYKLSGLIKLLMLLLVHVSVKAQYLTPSAQYASTIMADALKEHVYTLAGPEYEGRETGTDGNLKAAAYIASQLAGAGIPPLPGVASYYQEVAFSTIKWNTISLLVDDLPIDHLKDFMSVPVYFPEQTQPMRINAFTFLGYGIDDPQYSDYKGVDVKGKHLLIYGGEPIAANGRYRISGTDTVSEWSTNPFIKATVAKKAGAASIWIIENNLREMVSYARKNMLSGTMLMGSPEALMNNYLPHAIISPALGQQLTGKKLKKVIALREKISKTGKPAHTTIPADIRLTATHQIKSTPGLNVLGYIEGTDPALKDELVIVTAHYDHLGMRGKDIFFGADDNASGTGAVIEIARAFAQAKAGGQGPRRSVLCMLVTGEEKGLLGSQYYAEHPIFPLEKTVANINIDMIGRVDKKHPDPHYTYVIGSDRLSTELHDINEEANRMYTQLELDYTYNADDDPNRFYYRSDHYNFAKNGIPAIFYFSGVHDDYHRPSDTPDKILYDKAVSITRLAFHTTWELANRDERIKVNVTGRN